MRKLVAVAAASILAATTAIGIQARPVAAAVHQTKVVIVVGATHQYTAGYRSDADGLDGVWAGRNVSVTKIYSPNATWAAVKAAARGANILIYMGHGNGYPNPYSSTFYPQWSDGMGLNKSAGHGDSNVQYYGEEYMAQLGLAPNAVVLLNHLCYASGNSEEGKAWPSLDTAKKRVDNFGHGFALGGAKAVIAEGHGGLGGMLNAIFDSHGTIDAVWHGDSWSGTVYTWASPRTAGYTDQMEDSYYRSMVSIPGTLTDNIVNGAIPPFVSKAGTYVPLTPTRVVDTRGNGIGPTGALKSNTVYTFQITGKGGVPAGAIAITGNLTITGGTAAGYVTLGPQIWGWPDTSTINFPARDDRANGITVPLSDTGKLQAFYGASRLHSVQIIIDVTGYFVAGTSGKGFVAFGPKRILDTRPGDQNTGLTGKFWSQQTRKIKVAGVAGLPSSGVVAVVGNVTVTNANGKGFVYLSPNPVPAGQAPASSTINFPANDTRANNFVVPVNATDGSIYAIYWTKSPGPSTDLVIDIAGYFTDSGGTQLHTLNPTRIMDSRYNKGVSGAFSANVPKSLTVVGHGGVVSGATAIVANLTVTGQTGRGFGAAGPSISSGTPFSNLNFPTGDNRANGVTVPLNGEGGLQIVYGASGGKTANFVLDVGGYYLP